MPQHLIHCLFFFLNQLWMCVCPQIFAIQLLSYLCTQYALPKSLSVARLAISVMGTLLTGQWIVSLSWQLVHWCLWLLSSLLAYFFLSTGVSIIDFALNRLIVCCKSQCSLYAVYQLLSNSMCWYFLSQYLTATIWPFAVSAAFSLHYIRVWCVPVSWPLHLLVTQLLCVL